jgi:hypothetical protein
VRSTNFEAKTYSSETCQFLGNHWRNNTIWMSTRMCLILCGTVGIMCTTCSNHQELWKHFICITWLSEYAAVISVFQCFKGLVLVIEMQYLLWGFNWFLHIIYMNFGPQNVKIQQSGWWHFMKCWDWNWHTVYIFYTAVYEKLMNKYKSEKYFCNYFIYPQNSIILFLKISLWHFVAHTIHILTLVHESINAHNNVHITK